MDKKLKSILKSQIERYLQKTPHASDGKIIKWLYIGAVPDPHTLNAIKKRKPEKLCCLPEEVCNAWVLCWSLKGNGRPSVPGRKIAQVKRLMNNKERRSTRSRYATLPSFDLKICHRPSPLWPQDLPSSPPLISISAILSSFNLKICHPPLF